MKHTVKSYFDSEILDNTTEKMLQHDVADQKSITTITESTTLNNIDKISHEITDDFQKIPLILNLPFFTLKNLTTNLRKKYGNNGPSLNGFFEGKIMEWNKEFELQQHVSSLSFRGSFPRIDVLKRLHKISVELESWPEFPKFKRNHLEVIVRKIIGSIDPRTFEAYFECMVTFIETKKGNRISFYGDYDLSGFKNVIEEALTKSVKREGKESPGIEEYL